MINPYRRGVDGHGTGSLKNHTRPLREYSGFYKGAYMRGQDLHVLYAVTSSQNGMHVLGD